MVTRTTFVKVYIYIGLYMTTQFGFLDETYIFSGGLKTTRTGWCWYEEVSQTMLCLGGFIDQQSTL